MVPGSQPFQFPFKDPDENVPFRFMVRVLGTPVPPVRPPVGDLELHTLHESLIRVPVPFPDLLVGKDEPVVPCPDRRPRTLRCTPGPPLQGREGKGPPIRGDLPFLPEAVRVHPGMPAPDGHAGVDLSAEVLQIVV